MMFRIERNIRSLRRYAWSLSRGNSEADDLVQDCVWPRGRIGSLPSDSDLRAWLFAIMHNIFANRWRGDRQNDGRYVRQGHSRHRPQLRREDRSAPSIASAWLHDTTADQTQMRTSPAMRMALLWND